MKTRSVATVLCLCAVIASLMVRADAQNQAPGSSVRSPGMKQVAYIKASNAEAADHFACGGALDGHTGNSVAISADGNTMAIGAHQESSDARGVNENQNNNAAYASGAVYVYARTANGAWAQQAYVKASNARQGANFGAVVGLSADGNTMTVSSHFESSASKGVNGDQNDESIPQAGAVYVFSRTGTTWTQQAYLKASNTGRAPVAGVAEDWGDGDQFGFSVAISGDGNTVAVGAISEDGRASSINNAPFEADDSAASSGAVYVFARTGTAWSQQAYVKSANSRAGQLFGYGVGLSMDGNTMAVSGYDEGGSGRAPNAIPDQLRNGSGAIYVFSRADGNWRQSAYLKGSRSEGGDSLGYSVAISQDGNTIAGGTADEDCYTAGVNPQGCDNDRAANTSAGAAYVWVRNENNWTEQAFFKSSNPGLEDWFAVRMALSGDGNTLAVAAPLENSIGQGIDPKQDDDLATDAGAVYFFTRDGSTWTQKAFVKAAHNEAYDEFGSALALSGDGRTLLVGARGEDSAAQGINGNEQDNSASEAGAAFVFGYN
jgi:FG-GAP repeat